jgi:uncharacterized membrane protein YoaK (UPF0700 family)
MSADVARPARSTSSFTTRFVPAGLALIAGLTDITTFALLGGLFSAHITGDIVVLAAAAPAGSRVTIGTILAVPAFIVVAAITTVVAERFRDATARLISPLLAVQTVLLIAAGVVAVIGRTSAAPSPAAVAVALLAVSAMAVQNTLLHLSFAPSPTVAVMTGNLVAATVAGVQLLLRRDADAHARQMWRSTWPLLAGFVAGCIAGGVACAWIHEWAWLLPVAGSAILTAVAVIRRSTSRVAP